MSNMEKLLESELKVIDNAFEAGQRFNKKINEGCKKFNNFAYKFIIVPIMQTIFFLIGVFTFNKNK